jgi:protein phosphatase
VALRSLAGHEHFTSVDDLVTAVRRANSSIFRRATSESSLRGMGTTLCAMALVGGDGDDERLAVVNVGDSRAYQLRDGDLEQLTIDHSLVQMMVREGKLRPEDAANHPQRNIVLRALGIDADVEVDHWELDAVVGDRYLICSDGLFNEVPHGRMAATLRAYAEPAEAAKVLVGLANAAGGRDNITCVVVDVVRDTADAAAGPGDADDTAAVGRASTGSVGSVGRAGVARDGGGVAAGGDVTRSMDRTGGTTVLAASSALADDAALDDDLAAGDRGAAARRPKRFTLRVLAFLLVIVVVLGVAVLAVGWYATRTYFVGFEGDQVVIYQGRPGGLLWIDPTLAERTVPPLDRQALVGALCDRVEGQPSATNISAARGIVEQLRRDAAALHAPSTPCGGAG